MTSHIRNFAIIAHIDHGKSTLADRLLELTSTVSGSHEEQLLDRNPISRERGITIKLAPVRMKYASTSLSTSQEEPIDYQLNLIDTPGHVDFSYEVDRTLACVEGVLLLVDATQGIQAQTVSNAYKALDKNLTIIPVINKIDLPNAQVAKTKQNLMDFLGCGEGEISCISAKTGEGVLALLDRIVGEIPSPTVSTDGAHDLQALIFDSYFDPHRGVIAFVRVFGSEMRALVSCRMAATSAAFQATEVGIFTPELIPSEVIRTGEIGYVATNLKDIRQVSVGDTLLLAKSTTPSLPGYRKVQPMVYAGMFTTDTHEYENFTKALEKLALNDAALDYKAIHSQALGAGYRVGFLGLLHADVVRERLEREFALSLVLTPPSVDYTKVTEGIYDEPIARVLIVTPQEYAGAIMQLCEHYRSTFVGMDNKHEIQLTYRMPLGEMIGGFFDRLKSASSGYASLDWELAGYERVKADKLELLINSDPIEEFSEIVVADRAYEKGNFLTSRMKELIPRQQYEVKIQARYKGKIIASSRLAPYRKDVLVKNSKVIGAGDVGRKRKVLERQKEGKKKMKMVGKVEIPKEAFMKLFNQK